LRLRDFFIFFIAGPVRQLFNRTFRNLPHSQGETARPRAEIPIFRNLKFRNIDRAGARNNGGVGQPLTARRREVE
jgi:hypothetical protein